jgi:hypothetical protein
MVWIGGLTYVQCKGKVKDNINIQNYEVFHNLGNVEK